MKNKKIENVIVYVKKRELNEFYKVEYDIHMSNRGYKIAILHDMKKISKYEYYKYNDIYIPHFIMAVIGNEVHEIGNEKFFEKIGY